MTSSFRPDPIHGDRAFVPVPLAGAEAAEAAAGFTPAEALASPLPAAIDPASGRPGDPAAPTPDGRSNEGAAPADGLEDPARGPSAEGAAAPPPAPGPTPEEIAALEQAAYERGLATARVEHDRLQTACAAIEAAASRWQALAEASRAAREAGLLDLATRIARQWVGAELRLAPERIADLANRALAKLDGDARVVCALHPEDLARVEPALHERGVALVLEADPGLGRGDFRLDAEEGGIDGRLDVIARDLAETFEAWRASLEEAAPNAPGDVQPGDAAPADAEPAAEDTP